MEGATRLGQSLESPNGMAGGVDQADAGWRHLFLGAFRQSKNPMALLDEQRRHVDVNGAYLQLLGYPRDELIGRPVYEFVIGGPVLSEPEWRAALRKSQFTAAGDLRRADGGQVRVEVAGHPATVAGSRLVLAVALGVSRRGRQRSDGTRAGGEALSDRELDVLRLIALGASGPEIAEELQLSHHTVRAHVRNSMTKLGARSRAQLIAKVLGEGILWRDPI